MQEAVEIVQKLNDVQSVMMLEHIYKDIFSTFSYEEIQQNVKDNSSVSMLGKIDNDTLKQTIEPEQSVELTRKMLVCIANDPTLSCFVTNAWEEVEKDDSLMIGTIITLGIIANLTLFMATSELEFEYKGIKYKKTAATGEQIKAVLSPVTELVKKWVPGIA